MNDIPQPVNRSAFLQDGADERKRVRELVDQAIRAVIPPDQQVERRSRPESEYSWKEPTPNAALNAALLVIEIAQRKAYEAVLGLRAEGTTWQQAADLLGIEWSDQYARRERAYELVLGPAPKDSGLWRDRYLYWSCGGPNGCGKYITDRGPYNGYPSDCEDGHAENCRRHTAEREAHERGLELREERDRVADKAMKELEGHHFAVETVERARYVLSHGGRYLGWSTSEILAVALALHDDEQLESVGWSSRESALDRVFQGTRTPPQGTGWWLATVRAAATGETS